MHNTTALMSRVWQWNKNHMFMDGGACVYLLMLVRRRVSCLPPGESDWQDRQDDCGQNHAIKVMSFITGKKKREILKKKKWLTCKSGARELATNSQRTNRTYYFVWVLRDNDYGYNGKHHWKKRQWKVPPIELIISQIAHSIIIFVWLALFSCIFIFFCSLL